MSWRRNLVYSNLLVGFVAVGFMLGTFALLDIRIYVPLLVMAFCGTFLVYQIDRALFFSPEDHINQPARLAWARTHRSYVRLSTAAAALLAAAMLPLVRPLVRWAALVYALVGLIYAVPLGSERLRLKAVHLGKPILIALGWSLGGVLLPAFQAGVELTPALALLILYRFGFVLPNPLLADWMDRTGDVKFGIYTPAAYLQGRYLRRISQAVLGVTVLGAACAVTLFQATGLLWIDMAGPGLMLALVSTPLPQRRWFYLVTIDAVIAWPAVTAGVHFW